MWFGRPVGGRISSDGGQESQREHGERDVPVPCCPFPHLVVFQADFAFGGLKSLFDTPASAGHANKFGQG